VAINLFRLLTIYLAPVLPSLAREAAAFLRIKPLQWSDARRLLPAGAPDRNLPAPDDARPTRSC